MTTKEEIIATRDFIKNEYNLDILNKDDFYIVYNDNEKFKTFVKSVIKSDNYSSETYKNTLKICKNIKKHNKYLEENKDRYRECYPNFFKEKKYNDINFLQFFIVKDYFENISNINKYSHYMNLECIDQIKAMIHQGPQIGGDVKFSMQKYRFHIKDYQTLSNDFKLDKDYFFDIDYCITKINDLSKIIFKKLNTSFLEKLIIDINENENNFKVIDESNEILNEFHYERIELEEKIILIKSPFSYDTCRSSYVYADFLPFIFYKKEYNNYDILSLNIQKYIHNNIDCNIFIVKK